MTALAVAEAADLICIACALEDAKAAPSLYAHTHSNLQRVDPERRCDRCVSPFGHGKSDVATAEFLRLLEGHHDQEDGEGGAT